MPVQNKAKIIKQSRIGIELTDEQCAVLSDLIDIHEYADGDVFVPAGAMDDHLRIVISGTLSVKKFRRRGVDAPERADCG